MSRKDPLTLLVLLIFPVLLLLGSALSRPASAQILVNAWLPIVSAIQPLPSTSARQVVGGGGHYCALTAEGDVRCWGNNTLGQLGNRTRSTSNLPVSASLLGTSSNSAAMLAAGGGFNCALITDGRVACWGYNSYGQLGGGTAEETLELVEVTALGSTTRALDAGSMHACAIAQSGTLSCWGKNEYGQVGDGTRENRFVPVAVSGLTDAVTQIAAGETHTCALLEDGEVACWGDNNAGELGTGDWTQHLSPVMVKGLDERVQSIGTGLAYSCALTEAGAVLCWGSNQYRQLGVRDVVSSTIPIAIPELQSGVQQLALGSGHGCALTDAGSVLCWGYGNWQFAAADGQAIDAHPQIIPGLESGVVSIAAGGFGTCVTLENGGVKCWGENLGGQLGNGTWISSPEPVQVVSIYGS